MRREITLTFLDLHLRQEFIFPNRNNINCNEDHIAKNQSQVFIL